MTLSYKPVMLLALLDAVDESLISGLTGQLAVACIAFRR
jgi:hypothetical protein